MKKLLLLMVMAIGLLSTGCTKNTEETLVGTWNMTKMGKTIDAMLPVEGLGVGITLKFNGDKTAVFQYEIIGKETEVDKGVWEYNLTTGVITMTGDGEITTYNVKGLSSKGMTLEMPGDAFLFLVKQ